MMLLRRCAAVLCSIAGIVLGLSPGVPARAQLAQMSPEQARQALLPYIQAPDTTLVTNPVVELDTLTNHTEYLFYGADFGEGGRYRIDAATGEKHIDYVKRSQWPEDPTASHDVPLPASQLLQIATGFAAQHFPGYSASTLWGNNGGRLPSPDDYNAYNVVFGAHAPSGAQLPIVCHLDVEEDTGFVDYYTEKYIPVTVSTTPALTPDQAVQCGKDWINQNLSTDPTQVQFMTDRGGEPPVWLQVAIDPLLNQALVYEISFNFCPLTVDAQTGAIVGRDSWAGIGGGAHAGPKQSLAKREVMWTVTTNSGAALSHFAIETQGHTYLWQNYLKHVGIVSTLQGKWLKLRGDRKEIKLPVEQNAQGSGLAAWKRKGIIYVPVGALQSVTERLLVSPERQQIALNVPGLALASPTPGSAHSGPPQGLAKPPAPKGAVPVTK